MAAMNFPSSPVDGQTYTNPDTGVIYTYNSADGKWKTSVTSNAFLPLSGGTLSGALNVTDIKHASSASNNITLSSDGKTTIADRVGKSSYAIIADQKAQNTAGGTFTSGAWRTRDLNTEIADPDGIVSISSNQFTLNAGSYLIRWTAPAYDCNGHQTRLYNVTDSASVAVGQSCYCDSTYNVMNNSNGAARIAITASKAYRIEHQCTLTKSSEGFGTLCNLGTEQYTLVEIFKES